MNAHDVLQYSAPFGASAVRTACAATLAKQLHQLPAQIAARRCVDRCVNCLVAGLQGGLPRVLTLECGCDLFRGPSLLEQSANACPEQGPFLQLPWPSRCPAHSAASHACSMSVVAPSNARTTHPPDLMGGLVVVAPELTSDRAGRSAKTTCNFPCAFLVALHCHNRAALFGVQLVVAGRHQILRSKAGVRGVALQSRDHLSLLDGRLEKPPHPSRRAAQC